MIGRPQEPIAAPLLSPPPYKYCCYLPSPCCFIRTNCTRVTSLIHTNQNISLIIPLSPLQASLISRCKKKNALFFFGGEFFVSCHNFFFQSNHPSSSIPHLALRKPVSFFLRYIPCFLPPLTFLILVQHEGRYSCSFRFARFFKLNYCHTPVPYLAVIFDGFDVTFRCTGLAVH